MATGKKMGRPPGISPYSNKEQIKDELVQWISNGKTLRDCGAQHYGTGGNTIAE